MVNNKYKICNKYLSSPRGEFETGQGDREWEKDIQVEVESE